MHPESQIILGVAALRRKLNRPAMQAILHSIRRANPRFHIVILDDVLMQKPISLWPVVHVLLTLYSNSFPLEHVLEYVSLRSPILINNIHKQSFMMDRRDIRHRLARAHVPTPPAVVVDRQAGDYVTHPETNPDTLIVHSPSRRCSYTIEKPFVEKPVDPNDHNVFIYYRGGGLRKLFRKVKNQSSVYLPDCKTVRYAGDYIYEQFYEPEQRADVKVYCVGNYFHAEARKAPHIDGIVERDPRGRERRVKVALSQEELRICQRVASAFDQFVIGFDLLRGPGHKRFIIDVNGFSLVKNSQEYIERSGKLLADHIVAKFDENCLNQLRNNSHRLVRSTSQKSTASSSSDFFDPPTHAEGYPCPV